MPGRARVCRCRSSQSRGPKREAIRVRNGDAAKPGTPPKLHSGTPLEFAQKHIYLDRNRSYESPSLERGQAAADQLKWSVYQPESLEVNNYQWWWSLSSAQADLLIERPKFKSGTQVQRKAATSTVI